MDTVSQNEKVCTVCGQTKPLSSFKVSWFGHEHKCLSCRAPNRRGLARQRTRKGVRQRKCNICERWKPKNEFAKSKQNAGGIGYRCLECMAERSREKWEQDPEAWNEQNKASYHRHRKKRLRRVREYRQENLEDIRAYDRKRNKRRYQENPEKRLAYTHARRARERNAPGNYTGREFKTLCREYGNRCLCCGKKTKLTPDHVVPLSKGGSNEIGNIQPLCLQCNLVKATQIIDFRS